MDKKAFLAGKAFANKHPFSEFSADRDSNRLMDNCPPGLERYADCFKYGCQSVWRRSGNLPGMVAGDLEPGDVFTVDQPDPESPTRICLTNDDSKGLRFGFPNNKDFWCSMGSEVPVNLVK